MNDGTGQRRLAAILVADVVGYSRLMETDEAGTLAALRDWREGAVEPLVAEHAGRIVKFMGDGVLVEFASAVNAVTAALALQSAMGGLGSLPGRPALVLRVGVNLGEVVGEGSDIYGEGVNVAARLEALAEPGGVCISAKVFAEVRGRLQLAVEDRGEVALKNIAEPVRVYHLGGSRVEAAAAPQGSPAAPALPDRPSIAALPFTDMTGTHEADYFVDGMMEEIVTALSRFRSLFVVAPGSSYAYRDGRHSPHRIGVELGVRYILEGSVRRSGGRVRIAVRLVAAADGTQIWGERFEGTLEDVFALQDEVAGAVAAQIGGQIELAEVRRAEARPTRDLTAYDLFLRTSPLRRAHERDAFVGALALLDQVIARDANYAQALARAAFCQSWLYSVGWSDDPEAARAATLDLAHRALQAGGDDAETIAEAVGALSQLGGDIRPLVAQIDRAVAINPGAAFPLAWAGWIKTYAGLAGEAVAHFEHFLRLDPRSVQRPVALRGLALALVHLGRFGEAMQLATEVLHAMPNDVPAHLVMAVCLVEQGRLQEARPYADRFRELTPDLDRALATYRDPSFQSRVRRALMGATG